MTFRSWESTPGRWECSEEEEPLRGSVCVCGRGGGNGDDALRRRSHSKEVADALSWRGRSSTDAFLGRGSQIRRSSEKEALALSGLMSEP